MAQVTITDKRAAVGAITVASDDLIPIDRNDASGAVIAVSELKTFFDGYYQLALTAASFGDFIIAMASKATPINADSIIISDSAASGDAKEVTFTELKAFLKTYFDTLYQATGSYQATLTAANFGDFLVGLTGKTTPINADSIVITDSADSDDAKKVTLTNFKAFLKTYFDTLYQAILTAANFGDFLIGLTAKGIPIDADSILVSDSAASDDAKKTTLTQFKAFLKTYFDTLYTIKAREIQYTFTFGDGTNAIVAGTGYDVWVRAKEAFTITGNEFTADAASSAVLDIWVDTYANYPPTVADTITASAKPTLSAAAKSQDNTLTGWTTAVAKGSYIKVHIDSSATAKRLVLSLYGTAT